MGRTPHGTAAVSWANGRIDTFWVDTDRSLIHRAFADGAWLEAESLGGTLASAPAATAWAVDQLQVFAILDDGELWNRYWDGTSWHPWESLGGELTGSPAASSWGADRIDVFAPGRDGTLWHRWWDGTRWVEWERLPRNGGRLDEVLVGPARRRSLDPGPHDRGTSPSPVRIRGHRGPRARSRSHRWRSRCARSLR